MKIQRQHFLLSYIKTVSVSAVGVSNTRPPRNGPVHNQVSYRRAVHLLTRKLGKVKNIIYLVVRLQKLRFHVK